MKALKYLAILTVGFFLFVSCQKEFSLDSIPAGIKAGGSLKDTSGNCLPVTVKGNYVADSALTDSNFVVVQVNFSSPGSYNIATDTANGFSFQGAGAIKDSGLQNIILKGTGKPVLAAPTNFSLVFNSSVCTFSILVKADSTGTDSTGGATGPLAEDSAWQFTSGASFYHGYIDSAFVHTDTSISKDSSFLSFYGSSADDAADTLFQLDILLPGKTIKTGTYSTKSANVDFFLYPDKDGTPLPYYQAYSGLNAGVNLQVIITSFDAETQIISGSFSGTALNAAGQTVNITGGKVYAQIE